ncbi:glycosyltransferase family 2 protein [Kovacikia minuta CCNUW1]|uniref:glycosyltransferase family 2 protein n=1 Tax=Kovacikia minuta TaxID=2931930 RepID=UPI001CCA7686|nr:glycosyltransferase family 2 protein [Kovacikia minuta]UBF24686.1 glycosyltransferase family 2 protein [Kovacikia minuta CCNUW1]
MSLVEANSVYLIIPVHNRKELTLTCIENLSRQGALETYCVIVVDDGSTDGTGSAICTLYPEVIVLRGDGNLWWTGAVSMGMEYAISKGANYLIWLNDDCLPQAGAIEVLLDIVKQNSQVIAGGQSLDPRTGEPSYGGVLLKQGKIRPVHAPQTVSVPCEGLNGNFVCLSKAVVQSIGYPNNQWFPQYHGDTAYTHRAKKHGYKLVIAGNAIAHCKNDHIYLPSVEYWLQTDRSPWDIWSELFKIKSANYWKAELGLYTEFFGGLGFWFYLRDRLFRFLIITFIMVILPLKYRTKLIPLFTWLKAATNN